MKKKIVSIIILGIILISIGVFACTHKYQDSHLRKEGIRVRIPDGALAVDDCEYEDVTICNKKYTIDGKEQVLTFQYVDFKDNGYPKTLKAYINDHLFYQANDLDIETNGAFDYKFFKNFYVMDKYIMFTISEGINKNVTTLYAIDIEGNIILEEKEVDTDKMLINDYESNFVSYDGNTVKVNASRVDQNNNYKDKSICEANKKDIVKAYYIYTYKDGKFKKKQSEVITAKEYIEDNNITC